MAPNELPPSGLICPMVTPLNDQLHLDVESLTKLFKFIEKWVDGVVIGDPLWGEGPFLPHSLRLELVEAALAIVDGRMPLMISVTGPTIEETLLLQQQVEAMVRRLEYRGLLFWVDYPLYYHSNRGLPKVYSEMLSQASFPLILGNNARLIKMNKAPGRHKNIRTRVLKKIAHLSSIIGIIYSGDVKRALNYHMAVRFREQFVFYDGDEAVFIKNPAKGGVVAGGANIFPQQWSNVANMSLNLPLRQHAFESTQAITWEDSRMLERFHHLYMLSPAVSIKKILRQIGIIAHDGFFWPMAFDQKGVLAPAWQKDLDGLLNTYDIL